MEFLPRGWEKGIDRATLLKGLKGGWDSGATPEAYEIMIDEYLKDAKTPEDARDASLELLGDSFFVMPMLIAANYLRDAGVPVFLYEFQHPPEMQKARRPSFVKADHADDLTFMFGACFWSGHVKLNGTTTEEENQLCKTMMSYWANFARNGSPNGAGLVNWPQYEESRKYLKLDLQQSEGQDLKKDRVLFFTQELPKRLAALKGATR